MRITLAQTRPFKGDVTANIAQHKKLIGLAVEQRTNLIIFPELSITGYEPQLAEELAMAPDDPRLSDFQHLADCHTIIIGVGLPTKSSEGICISLLLFHPNNQTQTYSKKYLHADEEPFFVSGKNSSTSVRGTDIGLAICYEISVGEHSANAFANGSSIYLASVAKSAKGVEKAHDTLAQMAAQYQMTTLMVNSVGPSDDFIGAGCSAVWSIDGELLGQLDGESEGILVFDTASAEVIIHPC